MTATGYCALVIYCNDPKEQYDILSDLEDDLWRVTSNRRNSVKVYSRVQVSREEACKMADEILMRCRIPGTGTIVSMGYPLSCWQMITF